MLERIHNAVQTNLYLIALRTGCHQLTTRSFIIRNRQLPLCARCTGILVGLLLSPIFFFFPSMFLALICVAMFAADALTQLAGLRESQNLLRLATGIGFAYALVTVLLEGARRWSS